MNSFFLVGLIILHTIVHAQNCKHTFTEYTPLEDLAGKEYKGFTGGKYPDGTNTIPLQHYKIGMQNCARIYPLNSTGDIDTMNGSIGLLVLGFSTAAMAGKYFNDISTVMGVNEKVKILIGAQGGKDINAMQNTNAVYWKTIDSILQQHKLSKKQIQIIWISTGDIHNYLMPFPEQSMHLAQKYHVVLQNIKILYPNIRCVFISDRTYAGYLSDKGGPPELQEPTAYYTSWAVKWVIENQIQNKTGYTYHDLPFIEWGPMLWTNGEKGNSRGYTWDCDDAGKGGIHPTAKGRVKEGALLYWFFAKHPYTKNWFTD